MRGATGSEFGRIWGCRKGESEAGASERGRGLISIVSPEFLGIRNSVSPEFPGIRVPEFRLKLPRRWWRRGWLSFVNQEL